MCNICKIAFQSSIFQCRKQWNKHSDWKNADNDILLLAFCIFIIINAHSIRQTISFFQKAGSGNSRKADNRLHEWTLESI